MAKFQGVMTIINNEKIAKDTYKMILEGEAVQYIKAPGQFVNLKLFDQAQMPYLRRPMSICDYDETTLTIIYKVVGVGTKIMKDMIIGEKIDLLIGLGNGFKIPKIKEALLVGGGVGVPPLYNLAKRLTEKGIKVTTVLGFNSSVDLFYQDEFSEFGDVHVCTIDGTVGFKGHVIELIKDRSLTYDQYFACGPEKMLDALVMYDDQNGYLSFEARMGCGFGACMGCSCLVKTAPYKRICVEGPVLSASEVIVDGK